MQRGRKKAGDGNLRTVVLVKTGKKVQGGETWSGVQFSKTPPRVAGSFLVLEGRKSRRNTTKTPLNEKTTMGVGTEKGETDLFSEKIGAIISYVS